MSSEEELLQPRAAGKLLELLPTAAIGTSRLVEREALKDFLDGIQEADDTAAYVEEQRNRKTAVSRRKPRTLVRRDGEPGSLASLPQSITLSRCRLEVSFATLEELAQSLYALAQAMEADGDAMALLYAVEPVPEPQAEDDGVDAMFRELEAMEARGIARNDAVAAQTLLQVRDRSLRVRRPASFRPWPSIIRREKANLQRGRGADIDNGKESPSVPESATLH